MITQHDITENLKKCSEYLNSCSIKSFYIDNNKIIVRNTVWLKSNKYSDFLIFMRDVYLDSLEYLPKNFNLEVKGKIHLSNLKSKLLKDLIHDPGPKRQLVFNLLKA